MGYMNDGADSGETPIPLKYAKASDVSTEAFLAAARAVGTSMFHLYEVAWRLSDYGVPEKLTHAPDVSEFALKQKATLLVVRKVIAEPKPGLYRILPVPVG